MAIIVSCFRIYPFNQGTRYFCKNARPSEPRSDMTFFRPRSPRATFFLAAAPLLAARIACAEPAADALPTGFSSAHQVSTPVVSGAQMTIEQQAARAVIDWQSFNIGRDAQVDFQQPAGGVTVNRISGNSGDPTQIYGKLTANGTIFILDRNGIVFGKTARVDTAALIASTGDLAHDSASHIRIENIDAVPAAVIKNHGSITVADGGLAAFVAPSVRNSGIIHARMGTAVLASGKTAVLDFYGDGLWSAAVPEGVAQGLAAVRNSGVIQANGGTIYLTVKAAQQTADALINNTGVLSAQRFSARDGKIILHGTETDATFKNTLHAGTDADLQKAINSAADDGSTTLYLQAGVYTAALSVTKPLTIAGDADTSGTARIENIENAPVLTIAADNVTIKYLHIVGSIFAEGVSHLRLIGSTITQSGSAALHLVGTVSAEIAGNIFSYRGDAGPVSLERTQHTSLSGNLYLGSGAYGVKSDGDTDLQFSDDMFFGDYARWILRLSRRVIDDSRLRLGLPAEAPPDNNVDISIVSSTDVAALAALSPAAGDNDCTAETSDCR